jgi:uncharacterized DUF497 family protein
MGCPKGDLIHDGLQTDLGACWRHLEHYPGDSPETAQKIIGRSLALNGWSWAGIVFRILRNRDIRIASQAKSRKSERQDTE